MLSKMSGERRHETEWEGLRLVVEQRPKHWQVFVYDPDNCEIIFAGESITFDLGKRIAVEFTAMHIFGPKQDLKSDIVAEMLVWEPTLR